MWHVASVRGKVTQAESLWRCKGELPELHKDTNSLEKMNSLRVFQKTRARVNPTKPSSRFE